VCSRASIEPKPSVHLKKKKKKKIPPSCSRLSFSQLVRARPQRTCSIFQARLLSISQQAFLSHFSLVRSAARLVARRCATDARSSRPAHRLCGRRGAWCGHRLRGCRRGRLPLHRRALRPRHTHSFDPAIPRHGSQPKLDVLPHPERAEAIFSRRLQYRALVHIHLLLLNPRNEGSLCPRNEAVALAKVPGNDGAPARLAGRD
jgi:hypothetical protein